ncbi:FtsZ-interacting cell division protein ZipA [Priestia megaterium]
MSIVIITIIVGVLGLIGLIAAGFATNYKDTK